MGHVAQVFGDVGSVRCCASFLKGNCRSLASCKALNISQKRSDSLVSKIFTEPFRYPPPNPQSKNPTLVPVRRAVLLWVCFVPNRNST